MRKPNKLFRGIHNVSLSDNKGIVSLHTITSFSADWSVANRFASPKGIVLSIDNAFRLIYNGDLAAANVSWMSAFPGESEFIVLPTKLQVQNKILGDNKDYKDCIRDRANVHIYELRINQPNCALHYCKTFENMLIKFNQSKQNGELLPNQTVLRFALLDRCKYGQFWNECCHLLTDHQEHLQKYNDVSTEILVKDLSKCGVRIHENSAKDLCNFLLYFSTLHLLFPQVDWVHVLRNICRRYGCLRRFVNGLLHIVKEFNYQDKIELYDSLLLYERFTVYCLIEFFVTILFICTQNLLWLFGMDLPAICNLAFKMWQNWGILICFMWDIGKENRSFKMMLCMWALGFDLASYINKGLYPWLVRTWILVIFVPMMLLRLKRICDKLFKSADNVKYALDFVLLFSIGCGILTLSTKDVVLFTSDLIMNMFYNKKCCMYQIKGL